MSYEAKIAELGYKMPAPSKPVASYVMATRVGNLIYTGAFPSAPTGCLGANPRAAPLTRYAPHAHPPSCARARCSRSPARDL
jgi:hypothetical protein